MTAPEKVAERVARDSFGRLVAFLAARSGDMAGAEDALADALVAALERWGSEGLPDNPEGWLLTVSRRRMLDRFRHGKVTVAAADRLRMAQEEAQAMTDQPSTFPDERLKLLFACAHAAIDPGAHTPLMLQAALGLDAQRIASAFPISPSAMTKRLTRAKEKIRESGVAFALPDPGDLAIRLEPVLAAIYVAYGLGWDDPFGNDTKRRGLTEDAIWLGRLVVDQAPNEPEAKGLLALMLFCESRKMARRDPLGDYVPIGEQSVTLWSEALIDDAAALLRDAGRVSRIGRYQLEAAVQAVHAERRHGRTTDWDAIVHFYDGLVELSPTTGAVIGRAVALCEAGHPDAAFAGLDALERVRVERHQPFWATRAHVLERLGQRADAAADFVRAAGLTEDEAVRAYLLNRRRLLVN